MGGETLMMHTWQRSTNRKAKGGNFKGRHDQRVEDKGKTECGLQGVCL